MTDTATEARMTFENLGAVGSQVERGVMPLVQERAGFVAWLRLEPRTRDDYWKEDIKMGEHDAALAAWRFQQGKIDRLRGLAEWLLEAYHSDDGMPEAKDIARQAREALEAAK